MKSSLKSTSPIPIIKKAEPVPKDLTEIPSSNLKNIQLISDETAYKKNSNDKYSIAHDLKGGVGLNVFESLTLNLKSCQF